MNNKINVFLKINPRFYKYISPKYLQLIIIANEMCNFRCIYCYEKFSSKSISDRVLNSIIKLISTRLSELQMLDIGWFGGEPLLSYTSIINFMRNIKNLKHNYNSSVKIKGSITTNAYLLTLERFRELINNNIVEYQVTFDGWRDFHDSVRILASGKPTFDIIWNNLKNISKTDYDFKFIIRIHIHKNNLNSVKYLISNIAELVGNDQRFVLFVRQISHLGSPYDFYIDLPSYNDVKSIREYAKDLGLNIFESNLAVCYASTLNSFVIYPDGSIGKCTVLLYDERNKIGRINDDGTLSINDEKLLWWIRGILLDNDNIVKCPALV